MSGVNLVIVMGRLGADPDIKFSPSGKAIASLSIATSEKWRDKTTGDETVRVEWHRCVAFDRLAEVIGEFTKKGSQVYISGSLRTRKWQAKDGSDRYTTEVVVGNLQMLGKKDDGAHQDQMARTPHVKPGADQQAAAVDDFWDDIPL